MKSSNPGPSVDDLIRLHQGGDLAQALLISVEAPSQPAVLQRLAHSILCEEGGSPDCRCRSCQTPLANHPDFVELAPTSARTIRRDEVEEAVAATAAGPLWSPSRVIVVRPAESLGREAESYLLKHLEEPPAYVYYLLLTEVPDAMIATIKSRCQVWRMGEHAAEDTDLARGVLQDISSQPLTMNQVVRAAYWAREQYRLTGREHWLSLWDTLSEAFRQLEANGNDELARAQILRQWPMGETR
ncbi:MAG: DNA polymerase [Thermaerobacter sp.]|nr:DNA polymerase [Thermaerobacter sp.]